MRKFLIINVLCVLLGSCSGNRAISTYRDGEKDSLSYAKGFSISRHKDFIEVDIIDPWDTTKILQKYILIDRKREDEVINLPQGTIVKIPVKKSIAYSSVHISILELINKESSIVGACEIEYIDSKIVKDRVKEGLVYDLGEPMSPNIEKMIESQAEVIISSPFKDAGYGSVEKLNIPIIEGADYMESHPLGRVEWIKLYGLLFGAEQKADSIFNYTVKEYLSLKELASNVKSKPTVFSEKKYGGQWFVPTSESTTATLFNDAGADYIFNYTKGQGSIAFSFEAVLDKAIDADFWLLKYNSKTDLTYSELKSEYEPYQNFNAFKRKEVYVCNTNYIPYYDQVPMYPHLLLKDYIKIFHPQLLEGYQTKYFKKLSN